MRLIFVLLSFVCVVSLSSCSGNDDEIKVNDEGCSNEVITNNLIDDVAKLPRVFNLITPNGDGDNDRLVIVGLGDLDFDNELSVFDNGKLVFKTQNYGVKEVFEGVNVFDNTDLPEGSYKYELIIDNQRVFKMEGYLVVIRNKSSTISEKINACSVFTENDSLLD